MALTAEQAEAIILQRGETKSSATTKTRIYKIELKGGKRCTMLDMEGEPTEQCIKAINRVIGDENVSSITNDNIPATASRQAG